MCAGSHSEIEKPCYLLLRRQSEPNVRIGVSKTDNEIKTKLE